MSEQSMQALALANKTRLARAEIKRQIADGETTVARVLAAPPPEIATMSIADLLMSQHRWGRTRCRRLLMALTISETRRVGTLTERERNRIVAMLQYANPTRIEWAA